jgi:hypothetical protein
MTTTTEKHFNEAMMDIYRRARTEAGYTASLFHQMLIKHGGLGTAQRLLADTNVSDGYTALYLKGALHLTVEAVIFDNAEFHQLFSDDEMAVVRNRLVEYQYAPAVT